MLESILSGAASGITMAHMAACTLASLGLGLILAKIHTYKNQSSRNFLITLVLLPTIVQMVIMLVNGNLGTGVAVMGAFSLVCFRSMPGNAREITSVFLAMAIGLADGMGYIGIGMLLMAVVGTVNMGSLYELSYLPVLKSQEIEKAMLDEIRCRNGNLTIVCGRTMDGNDNL